MNKNTKQGLALGVAFAALVSVMPTKAEAQDRCIPEFSVDRIEVEDRNTLRFEMRNGDVYLNKLSGSLSGSYNFDPLVFDRTHRSAQYCRMDRVGILDRIARPTYPFQNHSLMFTASLGEFVKVEETDNV